MNIISQLQSLLNEQFFSEDGIAYRITLLPPLSESKIYQLKQDFPKGYLPKEIVELLSFASGIKDFGFTDVSFISVNEFGFESIFPNSVQLMGDGLGNFWIVDIYENGDWGHVYYVCHDPAVVIKHSENLTEFINHLHKYVLNGENSNLSTIYNEVLWKIWKENFGVININEALNSNDEILINFAKFLPQNFVIADLRNKPNQTGFAWGKFDQDLSKAIRHETELLWGFGPRIKKGFLNKFFG